MKPTLAGAIVTLALVSTACGADVVGPGVPECGSALDDSLSSATVLQAQALPEAEWGPCIDDLEIGWDYVPQFAESGRAMFWLDSDRISARFLEVELTGSCELGTAELQGQTEEGIERYVRVDEEPGEIVIAVIPVAPRHEVDAQALAERTATFELRGRALAPFVDESTGPAADRIQAALRTVGIALILDDLEVTTDTVELRRRGHDPRILGLEEALDEIADDFGPPTYRAEWFHRFGGGCVVYRFNASGAGAESVDAEVKEALGFYSLAELRAAVRQAGLEI